MKNDTIEKLGTILLGEEVWCTNDEWEACLEWQKRHPTPLSGPDRKGYVMWGFGKDGWWMGHYEDIRLPYLRNMQVCAQ